MLFIGDDWAEDHHDIAVVDEAGRLLAHRRLDEGVAGLEALHALLGGYLPDDAAPPTTRTPPGTPQTRTLNSAPLDSLEPWGI
jgi:hypothetical protein